MALCLLLGSAPAAEPDGSPTIEELTTQLTAARSADRVAAVKELARAGEKAVAELVKLLGPDTPRDETVRGRGLGRDRTARRATRFLRGGITA
jgi:hypothetical protein